MRIISTSDFAERHYTPYFGADRHGRFPLDGMLDELTFYRRALTAEEVGRCIGCAESGPCKSY